MWIKRNKFFLHLVSETLNIRRTFHELTDNLPSTYCLYSDNTVLVTSYPLRPNADDESIIITTGRLSGAERAKIEPRCLMKSDESWWRSPKCCFVIFSSASSQLFLAFFLKAENARCQSGCGWKEARGVFSYKNMKISAPDAMTQPHCVTDHREFQPVCALKKILLIALSRVTHWYTDVQCCTS